MRKKEIAIYVLSACIAVISFLFGVLVCMIFGSCTEYRIDDDLPAKEATVLIGITTGQTVGGGADTRAAINEYEVKSGVVLVYNANKVFEKSGVLGGSGTLQLTLREGEKYIYVVANPCAELKAKLDASPTYTQIGDMISTAGDYNSGNYPTQGLLMAGQGEQTAVVDQTNEITIQLAIRSTRVDLYINKGSADVENMTVTSVKLQNAHSTGYLFKDNAALTTVSTNTVTLINSAINSVVTGGTLVGTQYTYPAINATNISFLITLKHANASVADTYTVYLNTANSTSSVTLQQGYHYKVVITFSKDENGTLNITGYTTKNNDFIIG